MAKEVQTVIGKIYVYTVMEAARILNVHSDTIRRWADSGIIAAFRTNGHQRNRLLDSKEIDKLAGDRPELNRRIAEHAGRQVK